MLHLIIALHHGLTYCNHPSCPCWVDVKQRNLRRATWPEGMKQKPTTPCPQTLAQAGFRPTLPLFALTEMDSSFVTRTEPGTLQPHISFSLQWLTVSSAFHRCYTTVLLHMGGLLNQALIEASINTLACYKYWDSHLQQGSLMQWAYVTETHHLYVKVLITLQKQVSL